MSLLRGAIGLSKAALGRDQAQPSVVADRRRVCWRCPWRDASRNKCTRCGCWLIPKTLLASEHCPLRYW